MPRRILPPVALGLRSRLIAAFLLVALISTLSTAAFTYRVARSSMLRQSQDTAVTTLRDQVENLSQPRPLDLAGLQRQVSALGDRGNPHQWVVYGEYAGLHATSVADRPDTSHLISPPLRGEATGPGAHAAFQRVRSQGRTYLVAAMPSAISDQEGRRPTGAVYYAVMPLRSEQQTAALVVGSARDGVLVGLTIALVTALVATRGVLLPVRCLRDATRKMGQGLLGARAEVRGFDELADLARTFNESAQALEGAVAELQEAENRARRFAADVSHELRTPLAGMLAVSEILDDDADRADLAPDTASALRLISRETGRLAVLVDDLMEISRFDAHAARLNLDDIDLAAAVGQTLRRRNWLVDSRVHVDVPAGMRVRLDPRRLDVVVANLVGNALRHGAAPVRVSARRQPAPDGGRFCLVVSDQGRGISAEALPHVFDRFYKADQARTRSAGSGLGLAIASENVRLHGGTLRAANAASGGAVFTVSMPLRAGEGEGEERAGPHEARREYGRAVPRRAGTRRASSLRWAAALLGVLVSVSVAVLPLPDLGITRTGVVPSGRPALVSAPPTADGPAPTPSPTADGPAPTPSPAGPPTAGPPSAV
ncbi:ATP-binding protein [Streptomyces sp. NPDC059918]|uniref:ATP-binding protein n=1 Tax=unclassified Streptomyces TaxID=2593676 RepID=UPI00364D65FC